jgi:glycosyltransferase involved in cell wall biosynthesis
MPGAHGDTVTALFLNSGILGQVTFADAMRRAFERDVDGVRVVQVLVTEALTPAERVMRYLLCRPLWPAGLTGIKNLDLHRYRCEINAGILARNRLRRLERAGRRFDVLHFHNQTTAYTSLDVMRRIPSIVSIDSTPRIVLEQARSALERRTYGPNVRRDGEIFRAARLIVSMSDWAARALREDYPGCTTEIVVMPPPVPIPAQSETWIAERAARASAGARPRVLFMGGDFPRKGGFDLLAAWKSGAFHERADLDIATNWAIDGTSLPPGVTLHRGVTLQSEAWLALWRGADLFVLPTRDEAFGIVFLEAAAAGVPAIGTRLNAIPEIIGDGERGLLVPPGGLAELAHALDALIAAPDLRRGMGARARAWVREHADPGRYARELASAIGRLGRGR